MSSYTPHATIVHDSDSICMWEYQRHLLQSIWALIMSQMMPKGWPFVTTVGSIGQLLALKVTLKWMHQVYGPKTNMASINLLSV